MNRILIAPDECKGCCFCVAACPQQCISLSASINILGYPYAEFNSEKCTACGICFNICPEPGAITVIHEKNGPSHG
ncbi:MAG: 4Fe-4S binding protein [Chitinispirillaceae bacterium]|nr:4Fe-4S binding protein [Chitinispirillaceae bacterium]